MKLSLPFSPFILLSLLAVLASGARAASQAKEVWGTYSGTGFFNVESTTTVSLDGGKRRDESEHSRLIWSGSDRQIVIERTDLDKRWEIDPVHRRYTEASIKAAREEAERRMKKASDDFNKKHPESKKEEDPPYRIKKAQTTVTGPGAAVTVNGFTARPYTVKTVIEYETTADHKPLGRQTYYTKQWNSEDPALTQYQKDEIAFYQTDEMALSKAQIKQIQDVIKKELAKAESDPSKNPWMAFYGAYQKMKGTPVRSITVFGGGPGMPQETPAQATAVTETKDESLVQPGDLSNGVSGLVSGMAGRWASHKVEKKLAAKMTAHPAWIDDVSKELDGQSAGFAYMTEIKSVTTGAPAPELFEVPAGYKKVSQL